MISLFCAFSFKSIGYILLSLLALMIMITIHELGHYTVGKLLGFKINEFAIGFGNKLYSKKLKSGEIFSIRMLPLGGFCAFEGEDKDSSEERAFNNMPCFKRIPVLLAGVTFNFISAMIILGTFFAVYGYNMPIVKEAYQNQEIEQTFKQGDIILKVNGKNVYTAGTSNLAKLIGNSNTADFLIVRNNEKMEITAKKSQYIYINEDNTTETKEGYGIQLSYTSYKYGFFGSMGRGILFCFQIIGLIFTTIGQIFTGVLGIKGSLGGPITTISMMGSSIAEYGFRAFINLLGVMSASIAFMNILPLPALDGSRVVFVLIEWIRGKPVKREIEGLIHFVGLIVLLGFTILIDLINLF